MDYVTGLLSTQGWQGLDDDDTPGTSVVEPEYAFFWRGSPWFGRFGHGAPSSAGVSWFSWLHAPSGGNVDPAYWQSGGAVEDPGGVWDGTDNTPKWSRRATVGYFPAAGSRLYSSGAPATIGERGHFWSSGRHATDARYVSQSWFNATDFNATDTANRASGFTVRCVQEFTSFRDPQKLKK